MAYTEQDGFELGDTNLTDGDGAYWDTGYAGGATLVGNWDGSTGAPSPYAGTYCAKFYADVASESAWAYHYITPGDDEYFQAWVYVDAITADTTARICQILRGRNSSADRIITKILYQSASTFKLKMWIQLDGTTAETTGTTTFNTDQWYLIEMRYVCHATTGGGQLWVNGVLECSDIDNDTIFTNSQVTRWTVGGSTGVGFTAATVFYDEVKDHTSYIGSTTGLTISVNDSINIAEAKGVMVVGDVSDIEINTDFLPGGGDNIGLAESTTVDIGPPMYDAGWISEAVSIVVLAGGLAVNDTVTLAEEVTIKFTALNINVSSPIAIAEEVTAFWPMLNLSVNDSTALSELVVNSLFSEGQANVHDTITIGESATVLLPVLVPNVSDTIYAYDLFSSDLVSLTDLYPMGVDNVYTSESVHVVPVSTVISAVQGYYLGSTNGEVFEYKEDARSDDGANIICTWESKMLDFSDKYPQYAEALKTLSRVKLLYKDLDATAVIVSASIDDGVTWVSKTATVGTGDGQIKEHNFHFWLTGKNFRFKVEHTSDADRFQFIQLEATAVPSSDWFEVTA